MRSKEPSMIGSPSSALETRPREPRCATAWIKSSLSITRRDKAHAKVGRSEDHRAVSNVRRLQRLSGQANAGGFRHTRKRRPSTCALACTAWSHLGGYVARTEPAHQTL